MTQSKLFGAVEAGGTKFICAAGRGGDAILAQERFATSDPDQTFAQMRRFFSLVEKERGPFAAFGVAAFGPVDIDEASPTYGSILKTPKPGWTGANYLKALASFGAPVRVSSDVNGAALAEFALGAGRGCRTIAYVTVGTGIGVGVVRDGRALVGAGHYEMGHIRPPHDRARDSYPGLCPFHGDCFEGLAAGPAIAARWGAGLDELPPDHPAFDLEADYLAQLAATIMLAHMPEKIIFGGGVMNAPGLIEKIRARAAALLGDYVAVAPPEAIDAIIVAAMPGGLSGVRGALLLAGAPAGA